MLLLQILHASAKNPEIYDPPSDTPPLPFFGGMNNGRPISMKAGILKRRFSVAWHLKRFLSNWAFSQFIGERKKRDGSGNAIMLAANG